MPYYKRAAVKRVAAAAKGNQPGMHLEDHPYQADTSLHRDGNGCVNVEKYLRLHTSHYL